jgi:hypothetical protein
MVFYRYEAIQFTSMYGDTEYNQLQIPDPKLILRQYDLHKWAFAPQ